MPQYSSPSKGRTRDGIQLHVRAKVFKRDEFTCQYCGGDAVEIDHVIPVAHGGSRLASNLVAACRFCNHIASDSIFDTFEDKRDYILTFTERRVRRIRRKLSLCADCGVIYEYRQQGSTRVLCGDCYRLDLQGARTKKQRVFQQRMKELNTQIVRDEAIRIPPKR